MRKNEFSFTISPGAADDANEIALWYNNKIDGLGYRFLSKLKTSFEKIHSSPSSFTGYKKKSDIRRYAVNGFPYKNLLPFQK